MSIEKSKGSRTLSTAEYFIVMQMEYIQAEFRRKIYFNPKDKKYYEKVLNYKKNTIKGIADRNELSSIFTSNEKMEEIKKRCFRNGNGYPLFKMSETDLFNYFLPNNSFSYKGEIVNLISSDFKNKEAKVNHNSEIKTVSFTEIIRIL
jgi:hypothetical protein